MTSSPSSIPRTRRSGGAFSLRPAMQRNCSRCHDPLASPFDDCLRCSTMVAGVRRARLAVRLLAIAALLVAAGVLLLR